MKNGHLTQDELIAVLYEAGTAAAGEHLAACDPCAAALGEMRQVRSADAALAAAALSERQLARQRAAVYVRMEQSRPFAGRWMWMVAPAAAAAALFLAVGLPERTVQMEDSPKQAVVLPASDTLYSDIYQTVMQETPGAVYGVEGMFEAQAVKN